MYQLLLLFSLLHITTGSVYNVIPDDHYYPNTTCYHCHNLQHYLLNTTKYFTSNTQLLFLPGLHQLHTDLIMQNVHNITLIGSTTNGTTPDVVIQCNSSVGIVMTNITNLIVTNITVRSCLGNEYNNATVLIKQCTNVQLRHVVIEESNKSCGIVGINILGDSLFKYIISNSLQISYTEITIKNNRMHHYLSIDHYQNVYSNCSANTTFTFHHHVHTVIVSLTNSSLRNQTIELLFNNTDQGKSMFRAKSCCFTGNYNKSVFFIRELVEIHQGDAVWLENSSIFNYYFNTSFWDRLIILLNGPDIHIINCRFHHIYNAQILAKVYTKPVQRNIVLTKVIIVNTNFSSITGQLHFIYLRAGHLQLTGPIIFNNMNMSEGLIGLRYSDIKCSNYIEFANINTKYIVNYYSAELLVTDFVMLITENSKIKLTACTNICI